MKRHDNLLSWVLSMTKCNVAADLVIPIPSCPAKGSNEPIPGEIPGEFAHTATSTMASSIVVSAGIGSSCLRQLSR